MLKMTKVDLEKIRDADMHIFIEKCMRGGISCIIKRFSKANNEYCPNYDKNKHKVYINYHDMNNLYGGAMSEYLRYGCFKWINVNNKVVNRILDKSENSLHGYFLEVDLDYLEKLHDYHNDYPMVPKKIIIEDDMLSPCPLKIKKEFDIKTGGVNKLAPNLMSKKNYVVHYRNLQYYLFQGLILIKVHKMQEFKQSAWMKPYKAVNEANKNLFKLLNNAVYGKTVENRSKRIKIRTTTNEKDL